MTDSKLTEGIKVRCTEEMKQRAKNANQTQAKYVRQMWLAGESVVGELDPRVGRNDTEYNSEVDSAEAAAKALDDKVILSKLSSESQAYGEILDSLTQEFENVLANRLLDLANDDQSAVETDGKGNYFIDQ